MYLVHGFTLTTSAVAAACLATGCSAGVKTIDSSSAATARSTTSSNSASSAAPSGSTSQSSTTAPTSTTPTPTTPTPTTPTSTTPTSTASAGESSTTGLLDFPLPSGARVRTHVKDGHELAATIDVADPQTAYTFWKSALPGAGYAVTHAQFVVGAGEIRFAGHGCGGDSQIALTLSVVAVQCDLS